MVLVGVWFRFWLVGGGLLLLCLGVWACFCVWVCIDLLLGLGLLVLNVLRFDVGLGIVAVWGVA